MMHVHKSQMVTRSCQHFWLRAQVLGVAHVCALRVDVEALPDAFYRRVPDDLQPALPHICTSTELPACSCQRVDGIFICQRYLLGSKVGLCIANVSCFLA